MCFLRWVERLEHDAEQRLAAFALHGELGALEAAISDELAHAHGAVRDTRHVMELALIVVRCGSLLRVHR